MSAHTVRVDLDEELGSLLVAIKKYFGIKSDAEVLRVAIKETYRSITRHPDTRSLEDEVKELPLIRQLIEKYEGVLNALGEEQE